MKKVRDLQPGDMIDLEGDPAHADDPVVEFEYGVVQEVVRETDTCFVVHFDNVGSAAYDPDKEFELGEE